MLPSRAIGNVLFPTYEVVIYKLVVFKCFNVGMIKCSIPLAENRIHFHSAIHAVFADNSRILVKYMLISLLIKHKICFE